MIAAVVAAVVVGPDVRLASAAAAMKPAATVTTALSPRPIPETPGWLFTGSWSQNNGLPHNQVYSLLTDREGYLWIGTNGGAARFDGTRFTLFDDRQGALLDNMVRGIAQAPDGSIWIGTYGGGVVRHHGGATRAFTKREGLPDDFVVGVVADRRGRIWVGTDAGLGLLEPGASRFQVFNETHGLPRDAVKSLHADEDGDVWIGSNGGGLSRLREGRFSPVAVAGLSADRGIMNIRGSERRGLVLATYEGLFVLSGGTTRRYTVADGLSSDRVVSLSEDPDGTVWVGTVEGLDRLRAGRIEPMPSVGALGVAAIARDAEGGVFLAGGNALHMIRHGQFVSVTPEHGLSYYYATTLLEDRQGAMWIATGKGLNRLAGGVITRFGEAEGLPPALLGALAEDAAGHLWVGTDAGLFRSTAPLQGAAAASAAQGVRFLRVPGQPEPPVRARGMLVSRYGTLWMTGVMEGLVRHRDGVFTRYGTADGLSHVAVGGLAEDASGALWLGTRAGLNRLADGKFRAFTEKDGLPHDTVEALHLDREGVLWVATRRGVARMEGGRFTGLTAQHGLYSSYVYGMVDDDHGNLWLASSKGVFRVRQQEAAEVAAGKRRSLVSIAYGTEHGLVNTSASGGHHRSALSARDGRVWFAMSRGLAVVDPAHLQVGPPSLPVHLEELRVDGKLLPLTGRLEMLPGRGDLTVRYTAPSFAAPGLVRFRYRLDGHDADWVEAEERRLAQYANLPPGRYTFRVMAAGGHGLWGPNQAWVDFTLLPHWYQRWSFQVAGLACLALTILGLHRARVRQLGRRQRELETRVAERTAVLATINKELEAFSYSASHDLRAPLRTMHGFSKVLLTSHAGQLDQEGRDLLGRLEADSQRMQRLIDDMLMLARVRQGELRRQPVDLSAMATTILSELSASAPERQVTQVIAPGLVAKADPSLLRIALGNLLGNAWKFTSRKPQARIEVGQQPGGTEGELVFFVRDDGAGFDARHVNKLFQAFQRLHSPREFEGTGVGLTTVQRIVQRHGGRVWAEGAPDEGATFFFTLPER